MPQPNRGEIWLVDLGMAAKTRPCLLLSRYPADDELALIVVIPHTTAVRGNRWEFAAQLRFLEPGAFHLQQMQPVSLPRLIRQLGVMPAEAFAALKQRIVQELELS